MENILDKILEDGPSFCHINQLNKPRYKLFEPLFPEKSTTARTRKITPQEFLDDYHKSNLIELDDENEFVPKPRSAEIILALQNLQFKIDPFFETRLKLHQVSYIQTIDLLFVKKKTID